MDPDNHLLRIQWSGGACGRSGTGSRSSVQRSVPNALVATRRQNAPAAVLSCRNVIVQGGGWRSMISRAR